MVSYGSRLTRPMRRVSRVAFSRFLPLTAAVLLLVSGRHALANGPGSAPEGASSHGRDFRVVSPARGATLSSLPVEIKLCFPGNGGQDGFRAVLNGVDVTRRFGALRNHERRARFYRRHLNLGHNAFTAHYKGTEASVRFVVEQGSGLPGSSQSQPNYVPVATRIVSGHGGKISDYGVQVNGETYFAPSNTYQNLPATNGYGFQVLLFDRATLNLISNTSFGAASDGAVNTLTAALGNSSFYSGCGEYGCILILQSFAGIGAAGDLAVNYQSQVFSGIGGSGSLALQNDAATYSLIASVTPQGTAPQGSAFDRVCSTNSPACTSAAIAGAFILDNYSAYTFATNGRITFSTGTAPNSTSNVITVGTKQYASSTVASGQGGFQLLVLDSQTLTPLANHTFTPLNAQQLNSLAMYISNSFYYYCLPDINNCPLIVLSSIGNVAAPTSGTAQTAWWNLASYLQQSAGATFGVLTTLGAGDDYAMVGTQTASRQPAVEASSIISRAVQPQRSATPPSNIRGELALNHKSNYRVSLSNLSSTFNTSSTSLLDAVALQAPVAWPYPQPGHPGQQQAYLYFSQLSCSCNDLRSSYNNLNATLSDWYTKVSGAQYSTTLPFSSIDFGLLQTQLETELEYAQAIQQFEGNFNLLYTQQTTNVGLLLTQDYGIVSSNLYVPPPPVNHYASFGILTGLGDLFNLASYLTPLGPELQFGFDAASIAFNTGALFTNNNDGTPAIDQQGLLRSTYGNLAGDAANNFADGQEVLGNFFDLILSDWGRLQKLGLPLHQGTLAWDSSVSSAVLNSFDRSTRRQYLISLMAGVFQIEQDLGIANGAAPTSFVAAGCGSFTPGIKETVNDTSVWTFATGAFEGQLSWDGYVFWNVPACPASPQKVSSKVLGPLFAPLDPGDPTKLGQYGPWFYLNQTQVPVYNP